MNDILTIVGLLFCISQSACLSGLNLAVFSISRLRLEVAARNGDKSAKIVLALRSDGNFTLVTILWGNVAVNVLLTLLADSLMTGLMAFLFSTIAITLIGEIIPQAYFTRHALSVAAKLAPILRIYQFLFWPIAKPLGHLLDLWVGKESIPWFPEKELRDILRQHGQDPTTEVSQVEALGAMNFLALDDLPVRLEGEPLDPESVMSMPFRDDIPIFPAWESQAHDAFLRRLAAPEKKWLVITDDTDRPRLVLNSHNFLRQAIFKGRHGFDPLQHCHRPLIINDPNAPLGEVLVQLKVFAEKPGDDVIDEDLVLVWVEGQRRIITGSDILGFLLRRISRQIKR